jgi:plasmid replication initiation protein
MAWTDIKTELQELPREKLVDLLKGLHDLSAQNKAWLKARTLPIAQDSEYLEKCREKIVKAVYDPKRKMPNMPRFRDAKKVITEYKKATKDLRGTLDLMLTYVERGHAFTNDFGDIDEPFYNTLLNMFERFVEELKMSPARRELYSFFRARLLKMRATSDIGWGYGDEIQWNVDELEKTLNT